MIQVVNIRTLPGYPDVALEPWEVYIGRAHYNLDPSPLANPYSERQHGRDTCIELFRADLNLAMARGSINSKHLRVEIYRLAALHREHGKLTLVCWCKPKACHGDVIRSVLLQMEADRLETKAETVDSTPMTRVPSD